MNTGREADRRKDARGPADLWACATTMSACASPATPVPAVGGRPSAPCARRTQEAAFCRVGALKTEAARGKQADDGRIARIVDGLADLVPKAVGAILSTLASPLLDGIAGPATTFVLGKLKGARAARNWP